MGHNGATATDTLPKLFLENYRRHPDRTAMRRKDLGIWNRYTWKDCYEGVKHFALGLHQLGFARGDKLAIVGDNDPEWYWAQLAAQCLGGAAVGLYIDVIPSEAQFIADHSDSVMAAAKDQEQCDKFLEAAEHLPKLKKIIYWDPKGMRPYQELPEITSYEDVRALGRAFDEENPGFFEDCVAGGHGSDTAVLCYTSGTTGLPKGALISHNYLLKAGKKFSEINLYKSSDEYLSFVPLAWIAEQLFMVSWLIYSSPVNYPESPDTVMENIREIGPQFLLLGPRQWQGLVSMVQMKMNDAFIAKRWLYQLSMAIGYRYAEYRYESQQSPPIWLKALYRLADWTCLMHIRDSLGLSRARAGLTGGSALGPDVFRWFQSIGVNIKEAYGLTEVNPVAAHHEWAKAGTCGQVVSDVEIRITDEGEVWIKSDMCFDGYYKQPDETVKAMENGWFKTGDAGSFDEDGHLVIYDRMKDMLQLKGGERYSPTYIENRLKFSPYIKDGMVVGGRERESLFMIITIDFDNVGRWAEKNGYPYTTFVDLSQKPEVYDLVLKDVERVNLSLPEGARLKRFSLLHKEFDPDEGELTKSRKLRRGFLEDKYNDLIAAAYDGRPEVTTEAQVKYRDGRTSVIQTTISIRDV